MQGITATNNQFRDALRRGDAAGCAAVYTDNAKLLPSNSPMLSGKPAIQAFWQEAMNMGLRGATLTTAELEDKGDTLIDVGAYTLDLQPPGGQATKDEGKYVVIWKRQADGTWKIHVDMFNTNLPAS
jgi:uncharacterized protein (TIGR02246 family)